MSESELSEVKQFRSYAEESEAYNELYHRAFETTSAIIGSFKVKVHKRREHTRRTAFWVIAGCGNVPQELRAPMYTNLENHDEFLNYMGATLWLGEYNNKSFESMASGSCMQSLQMVKKIPEFHMSCLEGWVGVIDVKTDGSVDEKVILRSEQAKFHPFAPEKSLVSDRGGYYFDITSGRIRCQSDYRVTSTWIRHLRNGVWHCTGLECTNVMHRRTFCCTIHHECVYNEIADSIDNNIELEEFFRCEKLGCEDDQTIEDAENDYEKLFNVLFQVLDSHCVPSQLTSKLIDFCMLHPSDKRVYTETITQKGWHRMRRRIRVRRPIIIRDDTRNIPLPEEFENTDMLIFPEENSRYTPEYSTYMTFNVANLVSPSQTEDTVAVFEELQLCPNGVAILDDLLLYCGSYVKFNNDDQVVAVRFVFYGCRPENDTYQFRYSHDLIDEEQSLSSDGDSI